MDEATAAEVTAFLDRLAEALIVGNAPEIAACLAPWLGDSAGSELWAEIQEATQGLDGATGPPDTSELYDNPLSAEELREDSPDFPSEITDENFTAWCCVSIRADEGQSPLYDLWCAVVRTEAGLEVGYYEVEDPA
jgi:hypothetical protein